jgi:hypothetical protein
MLVSLTLRAFMLCGLVGLPLGVEGETRPADVLAPVLIAMLCCPVGDEGVDELGESREEHGRWCWVLGDGSNNSKFFRLIRSERT